MKVKLSSHPVLRQAMPAFLFLALAAAHAQNPTSAGNPFYGSVTAQPANDQTLKLTLDEAIRRGIENNLGLREARSDQENLKGQRDQALQQFLPTITLTGDSGFYQHNLVALGFNPSTLRQFTSFFPGGKVPAGFSTLTRDTLTEGMFHLNETLFSGPVIAGWRAAGAAERSAYFAMMSARGDTIQDVATVYLRSLADRSEVDNAHADVAEAQAIFDNAHAEHQAGTVAGIDELRAKVELQERQQAVIAAQNALDKDLILLKREIGVDPGQNIELTDTTPYADLEARDLPELMATAYRDRQDYQNLQNQAAGFKAIHAAYRSQRWPTLKFSGYYGTQTISTVGTHSVFMAIGTLSVPIFREAGLRGNEDASEAQLEAVNAQLDSLRQQIEQQVRSALLDVAASRQLVDVARSNVDLATHELNVETERVNAGIDSNLPLVTAQTSLVAAQRSLVESLYQYDVSKLNLARSTGVLESQYRAYLGH